MRLSDITSNSLEDRRGYLTIAILSKRDGKFLLRRIEGIKADITEEHFLLVKVIEWKVRVKIVSVMSEYRSGRGC